MHKNKHLIFIFITILLFSATTVNFILVFQPLDNLESLENYQETLFEVPNLKISGSEINITTPENKTYSEPMSGYYPSIYGFENDNTGTTGTNIGFIDTDNSATNCEASIISDLGDHKKILQLYDNSNSGRFDIANNFSSAQTSGTFEFWARFSDLSTKSTALYFGTQIFLTWDLGYIRNREGSVWNNIVALSDDTWYHFRIDFECDIGGYEDLEADEFNIWINGVKYGEYSFYTVSDDIDYLMMWSSTGDDNYYCYLDALGFSWDSNYNIGDNLNEGLLLTFENSTDLDWIGYSLDGQTNKTILGNTTFPIPVNGLHSIQVSGNDSLGDPYSSNLRYFTVDYHPINITTPENKTYSEPMSGYYPSTYGFENEIQGTSGTAIDYVDAESISSSCEVEIYNSYQGHQKVLKVDDGNAAGNAGAADYFDSTQTSGTVEWWWLIPASGDSRMWVHFHQDSLGTLAFSLNAINGVFNPDGGIIAQTYNVDQWYHHKIIFDCSSDIFDWYIDNILVVDDGAFANDVSNIGSTHIKGAWDSTGVSYFDAFGYSWDPNYQIEENMNEGLLLSFENSAALDWIGYSLDGQADKTILGNLTIPLPNDGQHNIQVTGLNFYGVNYYSELRYFSIDTKAPISIISFIPYISLNIVNESTEFSLTADDGLGSGVSLIRYKINDSSWITYSTPFTLSNYDYGVYLIAYQAIDNVGNIETENIQLVELIKEPSEPSEPIIHGYNLWIVIGIISIASIMVIIKKIRK